MLDGDCENGDAFDDGVYDGVSKVIVGEHPAHGVVYLKIEYMKDGDIVEKQHGTIRGQEITESVFAVDYPNEYITGIGGYFYRYIGSMALELHLETSRGRLSQMFGTNSTDRIARMQCIEAFNLEADGKALVGLYGRSGDVIYALEGRFATVASVHELSQCKGGNSGVPWDDGTYEGVNKVWAGESDGYLSYIKFEFCNGDVWVPSISQVGSFDRIKNLITHSHGEEPPEEPKEFAMLHDDEYITSIEGTDHRYDGSARLRALTSLKFKTSYNRESLLFGKPVGKKFIIQGEGFRTKLVGFSGISELDRLSALGAYFTVAPPLTFSVVQGGAIGGEENVNWDDGIPGRVSKIKVVSRWPRIYSIDLDYIDADHEYIIRHGGFGQVPPRDDTSLAPQEVFTDTLELDADDYVTSVEVGMSNYDDTLSISMLKIKTNRGRAQVLGPIGSDSSVKYAKRLLLQKKDHKIVGFFGRSSEFLEEIGAYLEPINDE